MGITGTACLQTTVEARRGLMLQECSQHLLLTLSTLLFVITFDQQAALQGEVFAMLIGPIASPEGCPLKPGRDLTFDSVQECEAFADWNFCRKSGAQRGRTRQAYYQYVNKAPDYGFLQEGCRVG